MERIWPDDKDHWLEMRLQDITSTEVSALFNCSPYLTHFELWHQKKDQKIVTIPETERMKWGTRLEPIIAKAAAEERGWKIQRMKYYGRRPNFRIGSSFDQYVRAERRIVECKNVDSLIFLTDWLDDGESIEGPPHIEIQVQHQLLVSGADCATLAVLVGGNRLVLIDREPDLTMHESIKKAVASFWKSIEHGEEPKVDFERDAEFIAQLYGSAEKGKEIEADEDLIKLARESDNLRQEESVIKKARMEMKARILMAVGDAEKVRYKDEEIKMSIACGQIAPTVVPATTRKGYRNCRVTFTRLKEKPNVQKADAV